MEGKSQSAKRGRGEKENPGYQKQTRGGIKDSKQVFDEKGGKSTQVRKVLIAK